MVKFACPEYHHVWKMMFLISDTFGKWYFLYGDWSMLCLDVFSLVQIQFNIKLKRTGKNQISEPKSTSKNRKIKIKKIGSNVCIYFVCFKFPLKLSFWNSTYRNFLTYRTIRTFAIFTFRKCSIKILWEVSLW